MLSGDRDTRRTLVAPTYPWLVGLVAVGAVVLRFAATGPLWLDEALSVNIARVPYGHLVDALKHDGSPPLYYLLLHLWTDLVGTGPVAVRALSGLLSLLALPAVYAFARTFTARRTALTATLLAAASPFAVRYATEARMYALVMLLVALGGLCLVRRIGPGVAACAGLLALAHYWALFLLAAVAAGLVVRRDWRMLGWAAAGGVLFLPWLPAFLFQLRHTGTPWAPRPQPGALVEAVWEWAGHSSAGRYLAVGLIALALLGLAGRATGRFTVEVDLRGRPYGRRLAAVTFGTLAVGVLAGLALGSGYAARYTAVVLVPFLVLVALGTEAIGDPRIRDATVAVVTVLGLGAGAAAVVHPRTEAAAVAAALRPGPGDRVVYCPDQLGPAVSRLLPRDVAQETFPTGGSPRFVDWVDYADRNEHADPVAYARDLTTRTTGAVWLVVSGGYRTYGDRCDLLTETLRALRPRNDTLVRSRRRYDPERMTLIRFDR